MKQDHYKIFVYGSLREGFHHPAYQYISRYFSFVSTGKIKGILYDMGEYPAAMPCAEDNFILGELYVIKNEEEFSYAIEQLDDYEGLCPEEQEGETALFRRIITDVHLNENEITKAWVYWYNRDVNGKPVIASGDVLEYFLAKNKH
jgi:gamma-glutamylcyclotransferase (GGCT)/AIG2-like uncharacterized protein YtfP